MRLLMSNLNKYYIYFLVVGLVAAFIYVISSATLTIFIIINMFSCLDCTITRVVVDNQGVVWPLFIAIVISYPIHKAAQAYLE